MIRLFRDIVPPGVLALLLCETLLLYFSFILAAFLLMPEAKSVVASLIMTPFVGPQQDSTKAKEQILFLASIPVVVLCMIIGLYIHDFYSRIQVKSRVVLAQQLCIVTGAVFLMEALISVVYKELALPVRVVALGSAFAVTFLFAWRLYFGLHAFKVMGRHKVLLLGGAPVLEEIGAAIDEHPEKGLAVAGYVDDRRDLDRPLPGGKHLGDTAALRDILTALRPDRIVVGFAERPGPLLVEDLFDARLAGFRIEDAPVTFEQVLGRVSIAKLDPSQLIYGRGLQPRPSEFFFQSIVNLVGSLLGLLLAMPAMLAIAVAIRLTSPGSVIVRSKRVGLDGAIFTLFRFRSGYDHVLARFLRRTRLDDLPQLWSVLRGDMSIVGPRPDRPEYVQVLAEYLPFYRYRHSVRPGLIGWAQVNADKYADTPADVLTRLEYDFYYIKNMSQGLDTFILVHTLKTLALTRGAD